MFKSKVEAYIYALSTLEALKPSLGEHATKAIGVAIKQIRIAVENHEQNPKVVADILKNVAKLKQLESGSANKLHLLANIIEKASYKQTRQEKFENPLGRRFESQMQVELLQNPTDEMMASVKIMSNQISDLIGKPNNSENHCEQNHLRQFLENLKHNAHYIGFGGLDKKPSIKEVKEILASNKPEDLSTIMFIHFKFAQIVFREISSTLKPPVRPPVGELLNIVKSLGFKKNPKEFFSTLNRERVGHISDTLFYGATLYKERGRGQVDRTVLPTKRMGLMRNSTGVYNEDMPEANQTWHPDVEYQEPNLKSPFVRDVVENDAVYVAGPSGMTSLFLGQMEVLANFETVAEKQAYLAAVSAYMIAGGFHSLHKVIGPAQHVLKLVPDYKVSVPKPNQTAEPPNYHAFYGMLEKNFPQYKQVRSQGWEKLISFFDKNLKPAMNKKLTSIENAEIAAKSKILPKVKKAIEHIDSYANKLLKNKDPDAQEKGRTLKDLATQLNTISDDQTSGISSLKDRITKTISAHMTSAAITSKHRGWAKRVGGFLKNVFKTIFTLGINPIYSKAKTGRFFAPIKTESQTRIENLQKIAEEKTNTDDAPQP